MTTQETYTLANELTEQEVNNVLAGWEKDNETTQIETYNSLVKLGDSKELALATTISEKYNNKGIGEIYTTAYTS